MHTICAHEPPDFLLENTRYGQTAKMFGRNIVEQQSSQPTALGGQSEKPIFVMAH